MKCMYFLLVYSLSAIDEQVCAYALSCFSQCVGNIWVNDKEQCP